MERWYQITPITLTTTTPEQILSRSCSILFNVPSIIQAMVTFRYIRWKAVEYRFQYSSIPMMYGWCGLSTVPIRASMYNMTSLQQYMSASDTVLLDFSQQQDVIMRAPWISPEQWCDIYWAQVTEDNLDLEDVGGVRVFNPINPVKTLDSTTSTQVVLQIYARFVDVELAGHLVDNTSMKYRPQMDKFSQFTQSMGSYLPNAVHMGTMSMPLRGVHPSIAHANEYVDDKLITERPGKPKTSGSPSGDTDEKELKPNLYGSLVATAPKYVLGSGSMETVTRDWSISDYIRIPTLHSTGSDISDAVVYSMFSVPAAPNYGRINYVSQAFRMWRGSVNLTFVFFSSPFITARVNLVLSYSQTGYFGLLGNEVVKDVTIRGTTRVDMTIPWLNQTPWLPVSFQTIATEFDIFQPRVGMNVIEAPQAVGDIEPSIPWVLYESAGEDFEFRSMINPSPYRVPAFRPQMRVSSFCAKTDVVGDGHVPKMPYIGDTEVTLDSALRRWSYRLPSQSAQGRPIDASSGRYGVFDMLCQLFLFHSGQMKFKMVLPEGATEQSVVVFRMANFLAQHGTGVILQQRVEDGMSAVNANVTQVIEGTSPFLATTHFLPIAPLVDTVATRYRLGSCPRYIWYSNLETDNESILPTTLLVSAGPDFSLFYPIPPPNVSVSYWPSYTHRHIPEFQKNSYDEIVTTTISTSSSDCTASEY